MLLRAACLPAACLPACLPACSSSSLACNSKTKSAAGAIASPPPRLSRARDDNSHFSLEHLHPHRACRARPRMMMRGLILLLAAPVWGQTVLKGTKFMYQKNCAGNPSAGTGDSVDANGNVEQACYSTDGTTYNKLTYGNTRVKWFMRVGTAAAAASGWRLVARIACLPSLPRAFSRPHRCPPPRPHSTKSSLFCPRSHSPHLLAHLMLSTCMLVRTALAATLWPSTPPQPP